MQLNSIAPFSKNTIVSPDKYEWRPCSIDDFFDELTHISSKSSSLLFRGQRKILWLLESTFARNLKLQRGINVGEWYPGNLSAIGIQHELAHAWLQKFFNLKIHPDLLELQSDGVDIHFEHHRHHQQNPKNHRIEDIEPFGTNFLDFTKSQDVGLFFANYLRSEGDEGALFIVQQTSLHNSFLSGGNSVLDKMNALQECITSNSDKLYDDLPLLIHPEKQLNNLLDPKILRQEAVYIMQMDFSVDIGFSWETLAKRTGQQVYMKLILPVGSQKRVQDFLDSRDITAEYLLPSTEFDS